MPRLLAHRVSEALKSTPARHGQAFRELLGQDLAIDLGTANTLV